MDFVILCTGRVGSELLVSLLGSHPAIRCYSELFAPRDRGGEWFGRSEQHDPRLYLSELLSGCDEAATGFKLPLSSIQAHPNAVTILDDVDLRAIRLTRENLLAQHISGVLAFKTDIWRQQGTSEESYQGMTHRVNPAKCRRALVNLEGREQEMDRLAEGHPTIRLTYEQLVAGFTEEVQRFLGVEPEGLSSRLRKLRTRPLRETIENWDELAAELRGTRFECFLVEESLSVS
jgi:LPS sulfotransferase NodH